MRKIFLITIICIALFACKAVSMVTDPKNSLPEGSIVIRVDINNYTYFQLKDKYFCCYKNYTADGYSVMNIFEVNKSIAKGDNQ